MKKLGSLVLGVAAVAAAVGVVAAVALPLLYRDVLGASSATASMDVPTVVDGSVASIANTKNLSGAWEIEGGSWAGYRVGATSVGGTEELAAHTTDVSGSLTVVGHTLIAADLMVDVKTLASAADAADAYVNTTLLEAGDYPTATFSLTTAVAMPANPVAGQVQTLQATGDLTLHGVTRTTTVSLAVTMSSDGVTVDGSIPVSFDDWGIETPDYGFVSVADTGTIEFSLQAAKQ